MLNNLLFIVSLIVQSPNYNCREMIFESESDIHNQKYNVAIEKLQDIFTNCELNEAELSMIQWMIHTSYEYLGNKRGSLDALVSFIVHAEIFMYRNPDSEWIVEFKVKEKIEFANVLVEAYWASITGNYCNSILRYCVLPKNNIELLVIYSALIPFCDNQNKTYLQIDKFSWPNIEMQQIKDIVIITAIKCNKKYYFKLKDLFE
jgi:hypothetical protein